MPLRTVIATRYVTPLREGGSLPAVIEADDDGLYVVKFRGAGQGTKALIAELVAGGLARAAGLPIPEIVFVELDAELGRSEPDPEIQDLIRASVGRNLGLDYLPGSVTFDPLAENVGADLASAIVWFDAFITNVDRTPRNANLLVWHRALWLIDHGAALYFHHQWANHLDNSRKPFTLIRDHVLLPYATALEAADTRMTAAITPSVVADVVATIPDDWLVDDPLFVGADAKDLQRKAYESTLIARLQAPRAFVEEALRAQRER
ncbi:MAG: HipA family kinase [Burkholderiaceae bacterium]